MNENFSQNDYIIRRKILKLFGGAFHVFDPSGKIVAYTKMKAFKLKEDLTMYESEAMTTSLFTIKARNILDFAATYDVSDSETGNKLGAFRRKALRSIFRDQWLVLDTNDAEIGEIAEDSAVLALVRRFVPFGAWVPQEYTCVIGGGEACRFRRNFNPFVSKVQVLMRGNPNVSRKLLMAAGMLLCAIEGKQG